MGVMELLIAIGAGLIASLLVSELYAWAPRLSAFLLRLAVMKLPESERSRMEEEWQAHLAEMPDGASRIISAAGFVLSSARIMQQFAPRPILARHCIAAWNDYLCRILEAKAAEQERLLKAELAELQRLRGRKKMH